MHRHSVGCQCVSVEDTEKYNLYRFVDVAGCRALNVRDAASAVHPFKPESQKRDRTTWCETDLDEDDDEERLVLHAPFVGTVRLRRLVFVAEGGARVAVYKNSPADWTTLDASPATQSFDLVDVDDRELTVVAPRFNDVRSLTFVFAERTRVYYVGMLGEWIKPASAPVNITYEAIPQLADHSTRADMTGNARLL